MARPVLTLALQEVIRRSGGLVWIMVESVETD
jgi:hypothetical protein